MTDKCPSRTEDELLEELVDIVNYTVLCTSYCFSVFANIDMRVFCNDIRDYLEKKQQRLYTKDLTSEYTNSYRPHVATLKSSNKKIIVKRCALVKESEDENTEKKIFVTALRLKERNPNPIIIVACSSNPQREYKLYPNLKCDFETGLLMPLTQDFYSEEAIIYDSTPAYISKKGSLQVHTSFEKLNIRNLCKMLRISSKGYFVQKISLSEKRFSKQMVHITEVQKDVAARSCQLLKINDLTQEIFLTNWTRKSTFLTVLACRTPTKTCQIESYANMSESLYKEYSDEPLPHTDVFSENVSDQLLENTSTNPYTPHRILENIDMLRFCLTLLENKFHESYRLTSNSTLLGFKVTQNNSVQLKTFNSPTPVRSRSCQMLKGKDSESREIFVAPSSAAKVDGAEPLYTAKNTVVVLACSNETALCTLEGILQLANLEDNFPILDMITNDSAYEDVQDLLPHIVNPYHRIFMDIDMTQFCADLQGFSAGFFIHSKIITDDQYDIHDKNQISQKSFYSRSCQLRRVDNTTREIFLAAPLFDDKYPYSKDTIFILSCLYQHCELETSALIFNFEDKYQRQYSRFQFYSNKYNERVLVALPGVNLDFSILDEYDIIDICEKVKAHSNGEYIDFWPTDTSDFPKHFITLILEQPYTEASVLARSCPLIVEHALQSTQIKITTPPTWNWNPLAAGITSVAILECRLFNNSCRHNRTLVIRDVSCENPEITMHYVHNTAAPTASGSTSSRIAGSKRLLDHGESSHGTSSTNSPKRSKTGFAVSDAEREAYTSQLSNDTPVHATGDQQGTNTSAQPDVEMQQSVESTPADFNYWHELYRSLENSTHDNADTSNAAPETDDLANLYDDDMFDVWMRKYGVQTEPEPADASSAPSTSASQMNPGLVDDDRGDQSRDT